MKNSLVAFAVLLSMGVTGTASAGDAAAGQAKTALCSTCHGADGNSVNPIWPSLAGQNPGYIAKQLRNFKAGSRQDPTMSPMALTVADTDIEDIAAYFASQTRKPASAPAEVVELGQRLYRGGNTEAGLSACIACHGPKGAGNPPAGFPAIAGQNAAYIAKALQDFRAGNRTNDPNKMMRDVAARMTEDEIKAVAGYLQGLY